MTRVAVMQPYLFPALPYLQLVDAADDFVFYNDTQFSHGRWTHRNRLLVGGEPFLFTVPLEERKPSRTLDEISLHPHAYARWRRKFLATIAQAYARSPFIDTVLPEVEELLEKPYATLADLSAATVRWLAGKFGIYARWINASEIAYDRNGSAQAKVLAIVDEMGGSDYINTAGGRALYDVDAFAQRGMRLGFMENLAGDGDGLGLSALHVTMHRSPAERAVLASTYAIDWSGEA